MASSSSSSSINQSFKYDVFLSFRGEDTRKNFVDHLYVALQQKSIHTYKDDKRLERGKGIKDELLKSIEESKFFIIIFSKNYASSSWCLDELVKIMECQKMAEQAAYPVFYDVDPSEVRKQHGAVGEAFSKHKKEEGTGKWRDALEEAANLAGWDLRKTVDGHEAKLIKMIVEEISLELRSIKLRADEKLIGMEPRIKDVVLSLETGVDNVFLIGIKGIGGGGKTTLARAVFDQIRFQFEGISFVENVREVSNSSVSGLKSLQKQILSDVLHDQGIIVGSVLDGINMMRKKLCGRKFLLVLDDVDHLDQLEALAGAPNWFKPGSRIIVTTRDEQVLVAHRVKWIHNVNLLSHEEAICLFSRYAFGRDAPIEGYEKLSVGVVRYAAGLPLTIRVLGSFLCGKDTLQWHDALERLKTIPLKETLEKLEISYTGLEDDYKEIFLDVTCHLKGAHKSYAFRMLESCGFHARNGLKVLEQKSLITISQDGYLGMHDHIEEMGMNIVRRVHPDEPNKHSRLWIREEIEDILANDLGTEATRCIQLWRPLQLSSISTMQGFRNMKNLRFLSMVSIVRPRDEKIDRVTRNFPNSLRFLSWEGYPHWFLPKVFQANNIVALIMPYSRIFKLWEGKEKKILNNLRFLDLSCSQLRTLDLGITPDLESLDLNGCHQLVEVHTPTGCLKRLVYLNLRGCSRFNSVLFMKRLELLMVLSLTELHLRVKLDEQFPNSSDNGLPNLWLTFCYKEELHSPIQNLQKFVSLDVRPCTQLVTFSGNICGWRYLRKLEINGSLPEVPRDIALLKCLLKLRFFSTCIKYLPDDICMLRQLISLKLESCWNLEKLPDDLGRLQSLEKLHLLSTRVKYLPGDICGLKYLKSLKIGANKLLHNLPNDLGKLISLEKLYFSSTEIKRLPVSLVALKHLRSLEVKSCGYLKRLPKDVGRLEYLEKLYLLSAAIKRLPDSICLLKHLKFLKLKCCQLLKKLPKDLGQLQCLENLILIECTSLRYIPNSICKMTSLRYVCLSFCSQVEKLPNKLGCLKRLEELDVKGTGISQLPQSIHLLKGVRVIGSRTLLESSGFAPEIQTWEGETFWDI